MHPSVLVAEVFSSLGTARFVHRIGLTPGLAVGLANRMGLERPSSTCKNVVTFATRKANFNCWELEWTQCWDVTHEVDDGYTPLASCSKTFL